MADFAAAVCESAWKRNSGGYEFSWYSGNSDFTIAYNRNHLGDSGTTSRGLCLAAVVFVVMVTVIEFSWLGRMASDGENAFIYFRF